MAILVTCGCGQQFQTREENAGRRARCPDCGRELIVPKPGALPDEDFAGLERVTTITSGKAIASLVLGLFSFVYFIIAGLPAIILGCLAMSDINKGRGRIKGSGLAITGVVLGSLGCLLWTFALLPPAVQAAREAARRSQCVNNLKQIGLAMHNFHSQHNHFPAAAIVDRSGKPLLSWRVAILPYIEQQTLYQKFHLAEPWDSPHNITLLAEMPKIYVCPSDPVAQPGMTTYQVVVGPRTIFTGGKPVSIREITDGTSNTILASETTKVVPWTAPEDLPMDATVLHSGFSSRHPGGINVLFADGSVRFLKTSVNPAIFDQLLTRDGNEVINGGSY